jgi:L-ascorbate metabolism protein UlaG (beta-lactamase superfamily)
MISPVLADEEFLADVRGANKSGDGFRLWWLGQSGYLLQYDQRHLLIDPYLSDSLTRKYAGTDKPHVRMTERVVDPRQLDFLSGVTSSHNHTDHLDGETLMPLLEVNPELVTVVPAANQAFAAERLQVPSERLTPIDEGQCVEVDDFTIHAVPAAHETVERDEDGRCRFLGYVVQFGPWTVYHSGDTVLYDGMVERLAGFGVDVALLPINGRKPERRVSGNLWGREAAKLAHDIGVRLVIPCHYEMFEFNTVTPDEFVAEATRLKQPFRLLRCGQRWSSDELGV